MDIRTICDLIAEGRDSRGYSVEPIHLLALLTEEVGELARALKPSWSEHYGLLDEASIKAELSDCLIVLLALARRLNVDVESSVMARIHVKFAPPE